MRIQQIICQSTSSIRSLHFCSRIDTNNNNGIGSLQRHFRRQKQPPPLFSITKVCRVSFGSESSNQVDKKELQQQDNYYDSGEETTNTTVSTTVMGDNDNSKGKQKQEEQQLKKLVGIMTGAVFFNNLGFGCVVPVLPLFATSMGLGATGVGTILSTSSLAGLLFNIPMGRAADTYGLKPLMVGGGCTVAVASIATGLCSNLPALLLCRMLVGTGGLAAGAGTGAYMADITSKIPHQRAKIAGIQNTVVNVAYAVGPAVGGTLCDMYGARSMFFLVGAVNAICAMGYFLLPEEKELSKSKLENYSTATSISNKPAANNHIDSNSSDGNSNDQESMWVVYQKLLQDPDRQGLMAMNFGIFCSLYQQEASFVWVPPSWRQSIPTMLPC